MGKLGRPKRRTGALVEKRRDEAEVNKRGYEQLLQFFTSATRLNRAPFVFDARSEEDRERLIKLVWSGDYKEALMSPEQYNPAAAHLLGMLTSNAYQPKPRFVEVAARNRTNLFAGVFSVLTRTQSKDNILLLPVLLGMQAYAMKVQTRFMDSVTCFYRGATLHEKWIEQFIADAVKRDPGPTYETLDGVGLAVFDNLTIQVGYKSYSADGLVGFRMDMTNWATIAVPRTLFGLRFDLATVCAPRAV